MKRQVSEQGKTGGAELAPAAGHRVFDFNLPAAPTRRIMHPKRLFAQLSHEASLEDDKKETRVRTKTIKKGHGANARGG